MDSDSADNSATAPFDSAPTGGPAEGTDEGAKLPVAICAGFHDAALTTQFLGVLPSYVQPVILSASPVSPVELHQQLLEKFGNPSDTTNPQVPLVVIGFSAGVVGLAGAVALWQQQGGQLAHFIAIDGWGVPLIGIPVTRLSHDFFTHVTSLPLGAGDKNFFAEPGVDHLNMWGEMDAVKGFEAVGWQTGEGTGVEMSAAAFLRRSLHAQWNQFFSWREH